MLYYKNLFPASKSSWHVLLSCKLTFHRRSCKYLLCTSDLSCMKNYCVIGVIQFLILGLKVFWGVGDADSSVWRMVGGPHDHSGLSKTSMTTRLPLRAKWWQKMPLQKKYLGAIFYFVKNTKQSLYKAKPLDCSLANRDTPVAATLQRNSSGEWFCNTYKEHITKDSVSRKHFVMILVRMATRPLR